ncbi:protein brambleberry-like [Anopheles aquasalis]|uniref:protein brambleberry-like n=1 Tax=Anopheles aquasalis TaxID=42839 RepID=UPI00215B3A0D|nr:protein brambleberry-like [Anopheles aquasalis]
MSSNGRWIVVMLLLVCVPSPLATASLLEYIWPAQENRGDHSTAIDTFPGVPYELSDGEEEFIREASKWIGMTLSKLDLCHHRIVLKLKKSCHELNGEQMGKLAVMLLNCQSDSEGRPLFPCTDEMSLRQCTERMDSDTWNAYHLITNRAKAVCASVRHEQFRGLTELTVNKLMSTAHEQLRMMGELADSQQQLQSLTREAVDEMVGNNERIMHQQGDIMKLSEVHRAKVESNFRELVREKSLIRAGQQEVAVLLTDLRARIDGSMRQLEQHSKRSKLNHDSLLTDLERLQANAAAIAAKIDDTGLHFAEHHRVAEEQYRYTLEQLQRINATVANVLQSLGSVRDDFNRQLAWFTEKVGGGENALQKAYIILLHFSFLLVGMICLAFVGADKMLRIALVVAVPGNMVGGLLELFQPDILRLFIALACIALVDVFVRLVLKYSSSGAGLPQSSTVNLERPSTTSTGQTPQRSSAEYRHYPENEPTDSENEEEDRYGRNTSRLRSITPSGLLRESLRRSVSRFSGTDDVRRSRTPVRAAERRSASQNRVQCTARTLRGDQCRSSAQTGSDYCRLHGPRGL